MRIVNWNMGGGFLYNAKTHNQAWEWVRDHEADVFLLQEAAPPDWAVDGGEFATVHFREKANASRARWGSGVFTRSPGWLTYEATDQYPWLSTLAGSCVIASPAFEGLPWLMSLHSSAAPLVVEAPLGMDKSRVLRCDDERWWEIDLIADSLSRLLVDQRFVAGGDINSSLLLDRGTRAANARLSGNLRQLGFIDLRTPPHPAVEPQTFFRSGSQPLELDYFLADPLTAMHSSGWNVLNDVVSENALSDHAPIQIDIE